MCPTGRCARRSWERIDRYEESDVDNSELFMPTVCSIGVSLPGFFASNEYVKELALTESSRTWLGDINHLSFLIDDFLEKAGSETRIWRCADSLPRDHILEAIEDCIRGLENWNPDRVSTVIYCGIDRGFVEPAHASVISSQIGLNGVRSFDIADACLGWYTACQAARAFASEARPLSLIVSAEFPIDKPGMVFPGAFRILDAYDFKWKAAAFTLGEVATATIINAAADPSNSIIQSENQYHDLCLVPLKKPSRFIKWRYNEYLIEQGCFISNSEKLAVSGFRPGLDVLKSLVDLVGLPDFILPHAFSDSVPRTIADRIGLSSKLHNVFRKVGNISTSSIPFSLWSISQENDLHGENIIGWVGSAGMKYAAFQIIYNQAIK